MEKHHIHGNTRRVVGVLDVVLTLAFSIQLILFTIHPLIREDPEPILFRNRNLTELEKGPLFQNRCWLQGVPGLCSMSPQHRRPAAQAKNEDKVGSWIFLVLLFALHTITPVMGSVMLFSSANPKTDGYWAREFTRFWMACNVITALVATEEFFASLIVRRYGNEIGLPIPTLVYICCRGILGVVMSKHLATISPPGVDDDAVEENDQMTCRNFNRKLSLQEGQSRKDFHRIQPCASTICPIHSFNGDRLSV